MSDRRVVDVSPLPDYAFGHHGLIWWGTVGFMVIEGAMFVIVLIAYFYLRLKSDAWPPSQPNPGLGPGTLNMLLALVSFAPALFAKRAAEAMDYRRSLRWLVALTVVGAVMVVVRMFEYPALNTRWDDNAYGSITWVLLSLHTVHVATDVVDGAVLAALLKRGPMSDKRFVDVSENSLYWYFIVFWWVPIYLTVYFAPRWL